MIKEFNELQIEEINLGKSHNVDVSVYAKLEFTALQMKDIRESLEQGKAVTEKLEFNEKQQTEIRRGLDHNVDVNLYNNPKFNEEQMREIRLGLEAGLDVSSYADHKFDVYQMREIKQKLLQQN